MTEELYAYLAPDRLHALVRGAELPDCAHGSILVARISGFTSLISELAMTLDARRSSEALFQQLTPILDVLAVQVANWRGSIVSFSSNTITCWFDEADGPAAPRAATAALAMQQAIRAAVTIMRPGGGTVALALKAAIASGLARRFVVGDPAIQLFDALAGETVSRAALLEGQSKAGEVLIDQPTAEWLGESAALGEWHTLGANMPYALLARLKHPVAPCPWPALPPNTPPAEQLRPWLLPAIFQRYQAGLGMLVNELRPAVALFARFGDIDYDGDNSARAKLDNFICAAQAVLERYQGTLILLAFNDKGSYLFVLFGAPVAHEDDVQRAVLTAFEFQQIATTLGGLAPLQIGIAKGTMIVGAYGAGIRQTYGAQSDEVNLAARLMMQAAPGETLVSGACQAALVKTFTLEPHEPVRLRHRPEPLPAFAVLRQRRRRSLRLEEPSYALPMIGRSAELALLGQVLDGVLAGQGRVLALSAEAGIGKSRLIAEGVRLARQRGLASYGGACLATATDSPYLVWEAIWRAFFDVDLEGTARKQIRMLERTVAGLAPDWADALPLLGPLLGLSLPDNDFTRTLQPKERQGALHGLLGECLAVAAREAQEEGGGLLLVLEDLHWVDSVSLDLLGDLAEAITDLPVLILLAYRPAVQERRTLTRLQALPHFGQIVLEGLRSTAAEDLIRAKLALLFPARRGVLPPQLVALLTERAQGNPFYLEELLNYLHDRALNPYDPAALAAVDLPETLYSLVLSRLDRLSARQQTLLKQASVIGRRFSVALLHGAFDPLRPLAELHSDLAALVHTDLIAPDSEMPEAAFLFKHVVTQQVAYESLSLGTRALLHERLAQHLERLAADDPEPYLESLAYHYDRTGNRDKQRSYHLQASRAAARRFANETAILHLSRVLELLPEDAPVQRFELVLEREQIYHITADRHKQGADIELLLKLADQLGDVQKKAKGLEEKVIYLTHISECTRADETARRLLGISQMHGLRINPKTYREWGYALSVIGSADEAQRIIQECMQQTFIINHLPSRVEILMALGIIQSHQGEYVEAQAILEEAVGIYKQIGNRKEEAFAGLILISNIIQLGNFEKLHTICKDALATARLIGDRYTEALVISCYGLGLSSLGRFSEALALLGQADTLLKLNHDIYGEIFNHKSFAILLDAMCEYEQAHTYIEQSITLATKINNSRQQCEAIAIQGFIHYHQDNPQDALVCHRAALQMAVAIRARPEQALAHIVGGLAYAALGDHQQAEACFTQALRLRRELHQIHLANGALAGLARLALERYHRTGLAEHLAQALAHAEEILSHITNWRLHGTHAPIDISMAVYEVLTVAGDPRADRVLEIAQTELHRRASTIDDPVARARYLARRSHQAVIVAHQARS
ncbi:MAG: hypothetical protein OHK0022_24320 [Roseiflexaceae bacterium]